MYCTYFQNGCFVNLIYSRLLRPSIKLNFFRNCEYVHFWIIKECHGFSLIVCFHNFVSYCKHTIHLAVLLIYKINTIYILNGPHFEIVKLNLNSICRAEQIDLLFLIKVLSFTNILLLSQSSVWLQLQRNYVSSFLSIAGL